MSQPIQKKLLEPPSQRKRKNSVKKSQPHELIFQSGHILSKEKGGKDANERREAKTKRDHATSQIGKKDRKQKKEGRCEKREGVVDF